MKNSRRKKPVAHKVHKQPRLSRVRAKSASSEDMMQPHYDFSMGEKPNYAKKFSDGATITIMGPNRRSSRKKRIETKSLVVLDSDVAKAFPNGKSVNTALRHLLAALPKRSKTSA